jgi:hypothetical protein
MQSSTMVFAVVTSPADGLTTDGYRFVGGEAGYVYVGHGSAVR